MSNPTIKINSSSLITAQQNEYGNLCNAYSPLQNLTNEHTELLGNFTTQKLNFDLEHPVDIITQDSYDGAVNLIINDGKNKPRLINSRFSVQNDTKFLIPDHTGYKDTNIYDEATFNIDSALKAIPLNIPKLKFLGLVNHVGTLKCGSYTFYFKLSDADGNETEIVQESGIVQIHIGDIKDPSSMRMGLQDENTSKSVKFKLSNIDSGFDYVHVLYARSSSGNDQAAVTTYYKVDYDYPVVNNQCEIEITGNERIIGTSEQQFYVNYADINSVKTQAVLNNVLMFGNVDTPIHDWDALRRMTWKIIPSYGTESNVGYVDNDYVFNQDRYVSSWSADELLRKSDKKSIKLKDTIKDPSADNSYVYYNPQNVYYKIGYWPDEIYRFGIVYIFEDMSLSPVFNVQGVDFSKISKNLTIDDMVEKVGDSDYIEWDCEPEDRYFDKDTRKNSRGVIKFPKVSNLKNTSVCQPQPLYIKFDLSYIGKYISDTSDCPDGGDKRNQGGYTAEEMFKFHKIKGFFFVRQKRIPTILAQGVIVGLTKKDNGSLPVIKDSYNNYISESFLTDEASGRLLEHNGRHFKVDSSNVTPQAMFVPDAEMMEATFNQIFVGNEFALNLVGQYEFKFNYDTGSSTLKSSTMYGNDYGDTYYKATLLNIPEDTKSLTDGENYFSTLVGNPDEPYKTADLKNVWNKTKPQDLTNSDTLVRGKWGPFVGVGIPENSKNIPYEYGQVYNIKQANYAKTSDQNSGEDIATYLDFQKRFNSAETYSAICDRMEYTPNVICYRGDCFQNMFTHRVLRNFIDPELPTNDKIVDPACWSANYGVRCTARVITSNHSNLTGGDEGWYIGNEASERRKNIITQSIIMLLTGSVLGAITLLSGLNNPTLPSKVGLSDNYAYYSKSKKWYTGDYQPTKLTFGGVDYPRGTELNDVYKLKDGNPIKIDEDVQPGYYLVGYYDSSITAPEETKDAYGFDATQVKLNAYLATDKNGNLIAWDDGDINQLYPNGFSNEICQAFETYVGGDSGGFNFFAPLSSLVSLIKHGDGKNGPSKKKVNPKEQESSGGLNFKALFKSDDNWELHGLASINRADVNAVGLGQWITFPICSTHNLALRDTDYSNATEQASFARKREFFPLRAMNPHDPLRDSNVINQATAISIPDKKYFGMPNVPFIKQEYFTRIVNSLRDSANSVTNQFKVMLEDAYHDYTKTHGSITKLVPLGNSVIIVFKHGVGIISLNLNSEYGAEGFLPLDCQIIDSDFGSMWKDSIIATDRGIYGVDTVGKKIWRCVGAQPLQFISDHIVGKFLIDNIDTSEFTTTPYIGHINVKTHYNAFKHDVMFTYYNDIPYDAEGKKVLLIGNNSDEANKLRDSIDHWERGTEWSLCYNEDQQMFTTFYDWIPVESANIDNIYFSFDREQCNDIAEGNVTSNKIIPNFIESATRGMLIERKFLMDSGFNNNVTVFYGDVNAKNPLVSFNITLNPDTVGCLSFYYKAKESGNFIVKFKRLNINASFKVDESNKDKWMTYFLFIKNLETSALEDEISIISENESKLYVSDFKYIELDPSQYEQEVMSLDSIITGKYPNVAIISKTYDFVNYVNSDAKVDPKLYWEIRNSINNIKLWKHGQAGIYDNQGEIKPTNWYGKQHEFNFEFVVNKPSSLAQKIYNNLKILSNKAEPYKFEYEVVGEGYDWYEFKPVIQWCNNYKNKLPFTSLEDTYSFVLSHTLQEIRESYPDFPVIFGKPGDYIIKKLPFLDIELSNRKGTKMLNSALDNQPDMYKDNTTETILVYDKQLSEYRVHTEQLANDIKKYGRIRGNMEYLEDLWNVEIRPVAFKYAYLKNKDPEIVYQTTYDYAGKNPCYDYNNSVKITVNGKEIKDGYIEDENSEVTMKLNLDPQVCCQIWQTDGNRSSEIKVIPANDRNSTHSVPEILPDGSLKYIVSLLAGDNDTHIYLQIYLRFGKKLGQLEYSPIQETRHRDKYIKIKVRYTGKDLAVIQGIFTALQYSKA